MAILRTLLVAFAGLAAAGAGSAHAETQREMARAFAAQAAYCVQRHDTRNAAFHGCVDWHSATHGVWALTAYQRLSEDNRYADVVDSALTPGALASELATIRADPRFEMPYGRAWFLRLAVEHARLLGDHRLDALATEIAASLRAHYEHTRADPLARDYASATWALVNLLLYARHTKNEALERFVVDKVRTDIVRPGLRCALSDEDDGFMSVCVTWAWLAAEALPNVEFKAWYAAWNPGLERLKPLSRFATDHDHGKNFSRAWGLRQLARATGDERLMGLYTRHIEAGYADWRATRGDYFAVGHWVAQFGMLAIQPLD
jgi:hypothetical protein